jgi:hypothetical protein
LPKTTNLRRVLSLAALLALDGQPRRTAAVVALALTRRLTPIAALARRLALFVVLGIVTRLGGVAALVLGLGLPPRLAPLNPVHGMLGRRSLGAILPRGDDRAEDGEYRQSAKETAAGCAAPHLSCQGVELIVVHWGLNGEDDLTRRCRWDVSAL